MKVAIAVFAVAVLASGCDWTMFRGNPAHTGFTVETAIGVGNVSTLQEKWTGATGEDVVSSPAIVGGSVYVGSNDNRVYSFSADGSTGCSGSPRTCNPLWRSSSLGGDVQGSPAVANGHLYVTTVGDNAVALDAAGQQNCSGSPVQCTPLWSFDLLSGSYQSPAVVNNVVYITENSDETRLHALDGATGAEDWGAVDIDTGSDAPLNFASPAVANGLVYSVAPIPDAPSGLYAYDAAGNTGCSGVPKKCSPIWEAPYNEFFNGSSSPAVAPNGVLYIVDEFSGLQAFDAKGVTNCTTATPRVCQPLWSAPNAGVSTPAIANGKVYTVSSDGHLNAFDANGVTNCTTTAPITCSPLWTTASFGTVVHSAPAIANGVVYIGSSTGLHAFDAATGASLWDSAATGMQQSSPAIANGFVYIGSTDNKLHAYALPL